MPMTEFGWSRHSGGLSSPATREDFLTAVSDLEAVMVRATVSQDDDDGSSYFKRASVDIAVSQETGYPARGVEECQCPEGYAGYSCQRCDGGYYRDESDRSGGPMGACRRCECSGNERGCSMGEDGGMVCQCRAGYEGDRCQERVGGGGGGEVPEDRRVVVTIEGPKIQIRQVGETAEFRCNVEQIVAVRLMSSLLLNLILLIAINRRLIL